MYICYANKTCSKQIFQFMTSECNQYIQFNYNAMQNCLVFSLNCCHKWSVQEWQRTWPRASLHSNVRTSKYQTAHRYPCYVGPSLLPFILPIIIKLFLRSASILIRWAGKAGKDLPTDQSTSLAPHALAIVILMYAHSVDCDHFTTIRAG